MHSYNLVFGFRSEIHVSTEGIGLIMRTETIHFTYCVLHPRLLREKKERRLFFSPPYCIIQAALCLVLLIGRRRVLYFEGMRLF